MRLSSAWLTPVGAAVTALVFLQLVIIGNEINASAAHIRAAQADAKAAARAILIRYPLVRPVPSPPVRIKFVEPCGIGGPCPPSRTQDFYQPSPPSGQSFVRPEYPVRALANRREGYVDFDFTIEPDGSVGDAKVIAEVSEGHGFAAADMKVFPRWRFAPKMQDGKPVKTEARYRVTFRLPQ